MQRIRIISFTFNLRESSLVVGIEVGIIAGIKLSMIPIALIRRNYYSFCRKGRRRRKRRKKLDRKKIKIKIRKDSGFDPSFFIAFESFD